MYKVNSNRTRWLVLTDERNSVYIDQFGKYRTSGKLVSNQEAFVGRILHLSKRCKFAIRNKNHCIIFIAPAWQIYVGFFISLARDDWWTPMINAYLYFSWKLQCTGDIKKTLNIQLKINRLDPTIIDFLSIIFKLKKIYRQT